MPAKRFNPREVSEILGLSVQGVQKQLRAGLYPNAELCECGRTTLVPNIDVKAQVKRKKRR